MATIDRDTIIDGRYRVLRRLGSGGMADVYLVEDQQLGRRVALKLLYHRLAEDQQFVERFRREASSAASLQHPNIVGIFDRGEWDGTYYIAMEYVEGRTLKDIVRERGPAPPDAAVDVVLQILRAARFAHQRGVVHRDIKPQNVLIDEEGRIKVADFGIARAGASDMTETGSVMGTAQYLSPEQAQGRPVDARSDLYSIGIVLYEMLTGRVPFDAESPVTVALKQVSEAPMLPREIDPAIPPALEGVVLRALEKDPAHRFANADEFIEALHRARLTPDEVIVTAPAPMEEILEEEERSSRRWWLWLLILLALAAIAFGLYTLLTPEQVKVPNVVGRQAATAAQILQDDGFEVQQTNIESDDTPRGEVAGQNPRAGQLADEGSTVTINVSAGPGQVPVPTVAGQSREEAEAALREAGLDVTVEEVFSDTVDKGKVVDTSPVAGTLVERGTSVTMRVSKGAERVEVPDVTGETSDDARTAIQGAGLRVGKITEEESEEDPGTVLGQSPAAGKRVAKNSAVDLTVAKGVEIPDVLDDTQDDATQALEDAGFKVRVRMRTVTTDDDVGIVLEQRPDAGEERAKGTEVTIIVGQLATSTPTPTATPTPTVGP
jgi:beta-lactam-binding protein with PASTA domain/predicted Ser/Thr protein kinase